MPLGVDGFRYPDLFSPERLRDLYHVFCTELKTRAPDVATSYEAYAKCQGAGMTPEQVSTVLLAVTPFVSAFVGRLFGVEKELAEPRRRGEGPLAALALQAGLREEARPQGRRRQGLEGHAGRGRRRRHDRDLRDVADGRRGRAEARHEPPARRGALRRQRSRAPRRGRRRRAQGGEGRRRAVDATSSAVAPSRSAPRSPSSWNASKVSEAACALGRSRGDAHGRRQPEGRRVRARRDRGLARGTARRITAIRRTTGRRSTSRRTLDYQQLVELRRPEPKIPELFVGPDHERRERDGFALTDRRGDPRTVEQEIDYCLYCHERDKDSCSKGLRDNKTERAEEEPARRHARTAVRSTRRSARCTSCVATATRSARSRSCASTTRCARAPATASATTA